MTATTSTSNTNSLDLRWGAIAIGREIGLNARQTFRLLEEGRLPARKIGKRWVADRGDLEAYFRAQA